MAGRRPLVLCIENALVWSQHELELQRHGYNVIAVTSARDALKVFRERAVDAVVLDPEMRETNPGAVLQLLKRLKPNIPVLLLASPFAKLPSGRFPAVDAVVVKTDAPCRLVEILDNLLNVKYPFFTRWFANWKHRVGA